MRRRRYTPPSDQTGVFGLNITSMTDMFTILLVFPLQTYTTSDIEITIDKGLKLPNSSSELNPTLAPQLTLTETELKLGDEVIAKIEQMNFQDKDIDRNDSNFIRPLFDILQKQMKEPNEKEKVAIEEGRILLKADQRFSYATIRQIMYTASMAGFPKLKLATVTGQ